MHDERVNPRPPRPAEALVRMVIEPRHRDSLSGDLLEEYRDTIVPSLGAGGADRWYVARALGFLWRAIWPWATLIAAVLVARGLVDTLAPTRYVPGVVHPRSSIMSGALMAVWLSSGFVGAWRLGRIGSGILVAFSAAVAGGALSVVGSLLQLALWHDPQHLDAIAQSGGVDEMLGGVALILVPVGTWVGTLGAIAGMVARVTIGPPRAVVGLFQRDRAAWICGGLLALSGIVREWLDWWLSPTQDFYARSTVSTSIGVTLFVAAGLWTGWRSRSLERSAVTGLTTGLVAAIAGDFVTAVQLLIKHDPQTMRMIAASGGLGEAFIMPFVIALVGSAMTLTSGALAAGISVSVDRFRAARP
jgi:hypothetical protein